jgi:DNA gyrase subunit A
MTKGDLIEEKFEDKRILDELKNSYLNYAMSVIVSRALPDVRDGLKPSQRRILVAMNDLNLGPRSKHRKCAKIVGDTGGNYHPHGDQATYGTLVRLGQDWNMRYTLVDPAGQLRQYRLRPPGRHAIHRGPHDAAATEMLEDLKCETVDFIPNYDETRMEPTVLPSKFPNLLVNGSTGIAVGMATNLAPHNLSEVCDALLLVIDDPQCGFKDILKVCRARTSRPAASSAARKGIVDAYTTGKGHLKSAARPRSRRARRGKGASSSPRYPTWSSRRPSSRRSPSASRRLAARGVDVRDESDRHGLRIVVELKKDADDQIALNKLFRYTPLQIDVRDSEYRAGQQPARDAEHPQMLNCFIDHRKEVIRRRSAVPAEKGSNRAHILEGLILAVSDIDEIIEMIKKSPDAPDGQSEPDEKAAEAGRDATLKKAAAEGVREGQGQREAVPHRPQADAILTMQLQRLTGLEIEKLAKEYAELSRR